jgi:hypothetical protein
MATKTNTNANVKSATPPSSNPAAPADPDVQLSSGEQTDLLWHAIGRFDLYINMVNTKAAFLIAFNTFTFGAIVLTIALKWDDLAKLTGGSKAVSFLDVAFLAIAAIAALCSLACTFWAVNPFLSSPQTTLSLIFFGDIAKYATGEDYLAKITPCTKTALAADLAGQAHILAKGAYSKFGWIRAAVKAVLVELAALLCLVLVHLIVALSLHLG